MTEDRSMVVNPGEVVRTQWVDVDVCVLANRTRMDFAAIERAGRKLLQLGDGQEWPCLNGVWWGGTFRVMDGRHEFLAALALGRERVLVAWKEKVDGAE